MNCEEMTGENGLWRIDQWIQTMGNDLQGKMNSL